MGFDCLYLLKDAIQGQAAAHGFGLLYLMFERNGLGKDTVFVLLLPRRLPFGFNAELDALNR